MAHVVRAVPAPSRRASPRRLAAVLVSVAGVIGAALTSAGSPSGAAPNDEQPTELLDDAHRANLEMIRSASVRNRNHDTSPWRDTAQRDLVARNHHGPRSDYLVARGGRTARSFPVSEGGQFRAECEFSHFAYDDPIVMPGRPGASHLHVFWGNTDTNAFSTHDTLINSGSSTCAGQELNRTGYWAPALFDASGNVRVPEWIGVYYKGYGQARDEAVVYPPGAAMVQTENLTEIGWDRGGVAPPSAAAGEPGEFSFNCSDNFRGLRTPGATASIPVCDGDLFFERDGVRDDPRMVLEMHVKFGNCWNGDDPADPANWGRARIGGWFYSECEERVTTPNIEYIIAYAVEIGESTEGWFLASDVDVSTGDVVSPGSSVHADWWGGWHPETNQTWIDNCTTFSTDEPSGCGFGYLSDGGPDGRNPLPGPALRRTQDFDGPSAVPAAQLSAELCPGREIDQPSDAASCRPTGDHASHGSETVSSSPTEVREVVTATERARRMSGFVVATVR